MDVITRCQNEFDVLEWRYQGVPVWPFLRMKIGHQLEQKKLASGVGFGRALTSKLRRVARAAATLLPQQQPTNGSAVFFNDGSGYYSDSAGTLRNKNYASIENAMAGFGIQDVLKYDYAETPFPVGDSVSIESYLDRQFIMASLRGRASRKIPATAVDHWKYNAFLDCLSNFEVDTDAVAIGRLLDFVEKWVSTRDALVDFFRPLKEGSLCLTTTYYGFYGMAFVSAMKKLGHVTADVQHGLQGPSHYAYADWPQGANTSFEQLPHLYLLWTGADVDNIESWAGRGAAQMIGAPVADSCSQRFRDIVISRKNAGDTVFLYSCSPMATEKKIGLLKQLADIKEEKAYFLIRAHPTEVKQLNGMKTYLESIDFGSYDLMETSTSALSEAIIHSDANISICSSTAIECNHYQVPSLLLEEYSKDILEIYNVGMFSYIRNQADLEIQIKNIITQRRVTRHPCSLNRHELASQAVKGMIQFGDVLKHTAHPGQN